MTERKRWTEVKVKPKNFNFKDTKILTLDFLDNGTDEYDVEIRKKDNSIDIIPHQVKFKVKEIISEEEGTFNVSGVQLMETLSILTNKKPSGKRIEIKKIQGRTDFENIYECTIINPKK